MKQKKDQRWEGETGHVPKKNCGTLPHFKSRNGHAEGIFLLFFDGVNTTIRSLSTKTYRH